MMHILFMKALQIFFKLTFLYAFYSEDSTGRDHLLDLSIDGKDNTNLMEIDIIN